MLRKLSILLALTSISLALFAQTPFEVNGQEVAPPDNTRALRWGCRKAKRKLGQPVNGQYYLIAQLAHLPNPEERAAITQRGIALKSYLGGNAYYITAPADGKWRKRIKGTIIVSLFPLPPKVKCSRFILSGDVPDYARKGGRMGISVGYYEGFPDEWVRKRLEELGANGRIRIMGEPFWSLEAWVSQEVALRIAGESWVQRVGLVSPPNELYREQASLQPSPLRLEPLAE